MRENIYPAWDRQTDNGPTDLVRQLVTQDGHRSGNPATKGVYESGADGQAVDEVMQHVSQEDHFHHGVGVLGVDTAKRISRYIYIIIHI